MADLIRSRLRLTLDHPWLTSLILRLQLHEVPDNDPRNPMNTAGTDGTTIIYNAGFVASLTQPQADGLYAHEALHCGLLHHTRRMGRDPMRWNVACDCAINPMILETGLQLPPDGCLPSVFGMPDGLSAEEYYEQLPKNVQSPQWGHVSDGHGDAKTQTSEWQKAMADAVRVASERGTLPAGLSRMVEEVLAPVIDWRALVKHHVERAAGREDYSFSRPSRRGLATGTILPAMHGVRALPVALIADTSGSVGAEELGQCVALIRSLLASSMAPETSWFFACDAEVTHRARMRAGMKVPVEWLKGGGGTDFVPALKEAEQTGCRLIIYITDLAGSHPARPPRVPVIWLTTALSPTKAPYGQTVYLPRTP